MLVTFSSKAWADITMFGDVAVKLIKLMGHSGTVPSALLAEDVPNALDRLNAALEQEKESSADKVEEEEDDEPGERKVGLALRAYPLIELLTAAARDKCDVMWHS